MDRIFRRGQLVSAAAYSLGHGTNDAQKTMGIIAVLLFSTGHLGPEFYVPFWVIMAAHAALALGTMIGRLAHREDHGHADHQAASGRRLLRGDRRAP